MFRTFKILAAAAALAFGLGGCASSTTTPPSSQSPAVGIYAAHSALNAALALADTYAALPPCNQIGVTAVCSQDAAVVQIYKAAVTAKAVLAAAEKTVLTPGVSNSVALAAVVGATNAVTALETIVSTYKTN